MEKLQNTHIEERGVVCEINWNGSSYSENSSLQYYAGIEHFRRTELKDLDVVIDIGTGNGKILADFFHSTSAKRIIGVEPNNSMIKEAREKYTSLGKLEFYSGHAENLPEIKDDNGQSLPKADLICSHSVLHFVFNLDKCFQDVYTQLVDGGLFVVGIPSIVDVSIDNKTIGTSVMAELAKKIFLTDFVEDKSCLQGISSWNFQPIEVYEKKMLNAGLEIVESKIEIYNNRFLGGRLQLKEWMKQVCPFLKYINIERQEAYFDLLADEYLKIFPLNSDLSVNVPFAQIEIASIKRSKN